MEKDDAKQTFGQVMKPQDLQEITREVKRVDKLQEDSIKRGDKPRPGVDLWGQEDGDDDDLDIEEIELIEASAPIPLSKEQHQSNIVVKEGVKSSNNNKIADDRDNIFNFTH